MTNNTIQIWLAAAVIVVVMIFGFFAVAPNDGLTQSDLTSELQSVIDGIVFPEVNLSGIEGRLDSLEVEVQEISEEDLSEEAEAERLVLDELDTRDFKEDIVYALNLYYNNTKDYTGCLLVNATIDCPVEKYKHITDIVVKDLDVDYEADDEEANVEVDLKVYYYIDGDEDEDEKALFKGIVFTVTDLDEDEDFEDAEVEDWESFEVAKVY